MDVVAVQTAKADAARRYGGVLSFTDPRIGGRGDATTDNTTAWNAAMALLAPSGGELFFPPGVYLINGTTNKVPGGVMLRGTGIDYSDPTVAAPARASVIRAGAAMSRLVELGNDINSSAAGDTAASIADLILDGRDLADDVVKTAGRRDYIRGCQVYWGKLAGVHMAGQNGYLLDSVIANNNKGSTVLIDGSQDNKVMRNQIRQSGAGSNGAIRIAGTADVQVIGNHIWQGSNGVPTAGVLFNIEGGVGGILINGNILEATLASQIYVNSTAGIASVNITGNLGWLTSGVTDNTQSFVKLDGGGSIADVAIVGNTLQGGGASARYKSLVEHSSTGVRARINVFANSIGYAATLFSGFVPTEHAGNSIYNGTTTVKARNSGKATLSGTGAQTAFTIAHSLVGAPASVRVTAGSAAAAAAFFVTADATNVTVTFTAAPASGTNNIVLNWQAEV